LNEETNNLGNESDLTDLDDLDVEDAKVKEDGYVRL
jgi:hypothetical protein